MNEQKQGKCGGMKVEDLAREAPLELTPEQAAAAHGGKVAMQDISFTTTVNKASPKLFLS